MMVIKYFYMLNWPGYDLGSLSPEKLTYTVLVVNDQRKEKQ